MTDKINAIIFDMGGVLIRTEDKTSRSNLAQRFNMTREQLEDLVFNSDSGNIATLGMKSAADHWRFVWDELKVPEAERESCQATFWKGDNLDGELVSFLRQQKKVRTTALLSNAWSDARTLLEMVHPCLDAFDVSIFSCEVRLAKPDPAIYRLALERVGTEPSQAIFVDDNGPNIAAAAALGIHAIRFQNTSQALGEIRRLL